MGDPVLKTLLIVLIDGFADWETPLIAGIGGDFYGLNARYVTPGGGDLTSIGGLRVAGLPDFLPRGDEVIVLCGSDGWCRADAPDLSVPLREAHDNGQTVAAICAATLSLARAGLLEGRAHTSNGLDFLKYHLPDYSAQQTYRDLPHAVADGGIVTAPGTAPVTFAGEVFRAAGLSQDKLAQFRQIATAEHRA